MDLTNAGKADRMIAHLMDEANGPDHQIRELISLVRRFAAELDEVCNAAEDAEAQVRGLQARVRRLEESSKARPDIRAFDADVLYHARRGCDAADIWRCLPLATEDEVDAALERLRDAGMLTKALED
jgi:hypothetical protein